MASVDYLVMLTCMGQKKVDLQVWSLSLLLPFLLHGQVLIPPSRPLGTQWDGVSMAGKEVHNWIGYPQQDWRICGGWRPWVKL